MKWSRLIVLLTTFIIGFSIMIFALINIYILNLGIGIICTIFTSLFLTFVYRAYIIILRDD